VDETPEQVSRLEAILSSSIERAGPFIRSSLQMPGHSLSAGQLLTYWNGLKTAAVAVSTAAGAPRVAPTGVALYRGTFIVPTVAEAARARAVRQRPQVSLSHFDEGDFAVIVHGSVDVVADGEPMDELCAFHRREANGEDVRRWQGTGVYLVVQPETIYTFARYPERFPAG
jgi:hypothetical protein